MQPLTTLSVQREEVSVEAGDQEQLASDQNGTGVAADVTVASLERPEEMRIGLRLFRAAQTPGTGDEQASQTQNVYETTNHGCLQVHVLKRWL
jgi:hypothetical protein